MSSLKLNLEKCEIIELGSMTIKQSNVPKQLVKLKINRSIFKTLGIWFAKDPKQCIELNYDERLKKINCVWVASEVLPNSVPSCEEFSSDLYCHWSSLSYLKM